MIDIKFLRENPDIVKENIKKKFQDQKLLIKSEETFRQRQMQSELRRIRFLNRSVL